MALNAETRIRKATETVMNMFHNAYDEYINHLVRERDAALHQLSEAKAETERMKEEGLKLRQEAECIKEEMVRWKREAEASRRQLASTRVRMSLTIVPLGDPGTSGSPPKPDILHNDGPASYCSLDHIFSDDSPQSKRQRQMVEVRAITLEESMSASEFDEITQEVKIPQTIGEHAPWSSTPPRKSTSEEVEKIVLPS